MKHFLLSFLTLLGICARAQVKLVSSNLPLIVINTAGQDIIDDPKITATMGIIDNGPGKRNQLTDSFNLYNGPIGIEIRGQSSTMFPMKSYGFELRDGTGNQISQSLFGMPSESDWILYAPYNDKTLMRNFLAYTLSNGLGHWAAHCRFTEVVLNGQYIGIYVFMEKIKRGSGRIDIAKLKTSDNSGDAVTGGYIFSIDKDATGWISKYPPPNAPNASIQYAYVYPKPEDISAAQTAYLKSQLDSFEDALAGIDYRDSVKGYRSFIDESSFIDYLIVNEVTHNVDGYRLSSYFNKDKDSHDPKIHAGPVWDYDLAFRNVNYCDGSLTSGWAFNFNAVCPTDYWEVPFWWTRMYSDTAFRSHLYCRWTQERASLINTSQFNAWIDSVAALTAEARQRHFTQWPVLGTYVWPNPNPIPDDYDGEIQALKNWLQDRLAWIDANLEARGSCASLEIEAYDIRVFPNPGEDIVTVGTKVPVPQIMRFEVLSTQGRRMTAGNAQLGAGVNRIPLTIDSWPAGIYIMRAYFDSGVNKTYKIVKR